MIRAALLSACLALPATAQEVVATRTLPAGTVLSRAHLDIPAGTMDAEAGKTMLQDMVGMEVRRAIYAGRAVKRSSLGPPTLVERNAIVSMEYRSGGLSIRTEGRALASGGRGERIRVMNLGSRRPVQSTVIGPSRVAVRR